MKKLNLILALIISTISFAQINFESTTWNQIKAKAKKEHKLIFVDAYTSWCGPCKWMAKNVFTNDTVAQYFNSHFINAKLDMEKGEGLEIAKQYTVQVYPTYLFLDGDGTLIHRAVGAWYASFFIQYAKDAENPEKQLRTFDLKYNSGNWDAQFLKTYLSLLNEIGLRKDVQIKLATYLLKQKESDFIIPENWDLIKIFSNNHNSKEFKYLVSHKNEFDKKYGEEIIDKKIYNVYDNAFMTFINSKTLDTLTFNKIKSDVLKTSFKNNGKLIFNAELRYYELIEDYNMYSKTANTYVTSYEVNPYDLNNIAYVFYEHITDTDLLKKAEEWAKTAVDKQKNDPYFIDTYACLLFKNNKKQKALELEQTVLEIIKKNPNDYASTFVADVEKNISNWKK